MLGKIALASPVNSLVLREKVFSFFLILLVLHPQNKNNTL